MDWKSRLYERYTSTHVMSDVESVRAQLQARIPYMRRFLERHVSPERSARILDLGCGYGALLHALSQRGYNNLSGVDVSPEQIAVARQLVTCPLVESDLLGYLRSLPAGSLDVVIAFDVLEHFTRPELLDVVNEIARVLAPEGRLLVHVPNGEGIFWGAIRYGDLTHELALTRDSLNQLSNACGLRLVSVHEDTPVPHGAVSTLRTALWWLLTFNLRLLRMAESGARWNSIVLSQNLVAVIAKP